MHGLDLSGAMGASEKEPRSAEQCANRNRMEARVRDLQLKRLDARTLMIEERPITLPQLEALVFLLKDSEPWDPQPVTENA